MNAPQDFRFQGPVRWVPGPGPAGVTLLGVVIESGGQASSAQLSLMCSERPALPPTLADVTVEAQAAPDIVLRSGAQIFHLRCSTMQLHRDVGTTFYAAIPPRPTPWARRLGWGVMLTAANSAPGRWLLSRLSRKP